MKNQITIHFVEPKTRIRAQLSSLAFDLGHHAEVYADLGELSLRPLSGGILVVRDGLEGRNIELLMTRMADLGIWLPVIAMDEDPRPGQVVSAMRAGALDYLRLPISHEKLDDTIALVASEADAFGAARRKVIDARGKISKLSKREREVLDWLTRGHSNKAIARELDISPRTVEIHRANMMSKLHASHAAEAVRLRIEAQLDTRMETQQAEAAG